MLDTDGSCSGGPEHGSVGISCNDPCPVMSPFYLNRPGINRVDLKSILSQSILLTAAMWLTACTSDAGTPTVNAMETTIAQQVAQTLDAYSATPPPPTVTQAPIFTETATAEATRGKPP